MPAKNALTVVEGNAAQRISGVGTQEFLEGGDEMDNLFRQKDWAQTSLGRTATWPQSLRSAVSICLGSPFPTAIYWGPELVLLYNDAWSPIPGAKHPEALGQPASAVWPESWQIIGPLLEHVTRTGKATRSKDQPLAMRRDGYIEECYFDSTFSPIRGESGRVEGIFNAVLETTERVIIERRLRLVCDLSACLAEARTYADVIAMAAETVGKDSADVPFALIYMFSSEEMEARLAATVNLNADTLASPQRISLAEQAGVPPPWPLVDALRTEEPVLVEDIKVRFGLLPGGPWPESPSEALVLPIARAGRELPYGWLVAGISPRRALDANYREVFNSSTTHIARALANADVYEQEQKRANGAAAREAALRAEAEAARDEAISVLESITDGFVGLDKEWRYTYVNSEAERLNGMSREDMLGRSPWEIFPEAIGTMVYRELHRASLERVAVELDHYYAPWERWFHLKVYPTADGGLSLFYQDVTQNYLAAAERDRVNILLTTILNSSPDVIAAKDLEGRYLAVNEATTRLIGCSVGELVGRTDLELASRDTAEPLMAVDREVMRTGTVLSVEEQYPDQTGKVRTFQSNKAPLREANGAVFGMIVVARDVTEQRQAERLLIESEAHQAFLLKLTDALRAAPDFREVVTRAGALLGGHLSAGSVGYAEADSTGDYITVLHDWTAASFSGDVGTHLLSDYGQPMAADLRAGRTVRVDDTEAGRAAGPLQQKAYAAVGTRAFVRVPLIRTGGLAAILFVLTKSPRVWSNTEISLIEETAARVWASVEKVRAENALRASEARFRAAVEANSSIIWTNNARGGMEGEQPGWGAFTGQLKHEYQGYGWSKAVHPDDSQPTIDAWNEAVAGRRMFAFAHRVRRYDGIWRACIIRAAPVLDSQGNIVEWVGVHSDITEERNLLTALQLSESRFRQLADAMPQMVWTAGPDGSIDYYNERWFAFTGFNRQTFGDISSWESMIHPEDRAKLREASRSAVSTGGSCRAEYRFLDRKTGSYRWFLCQALSVKDEQGRILKWFGTCTDIDEQKNTEQELRQANQDMEQFAYSASHDLQEPIRSVGIYSELLDKRYRDKLDGQGIEFLAYLKGGASRMEMLVRDLLAYTQVTRIEAPPEETDANVVLKGVLSSLSESITQSHAQISFSPLPILNVHRTHLHQLFQNLIGNAMKYCSNRAPVVHLEAERQNGNWLISVRDNGIGIGPEYKERIFGLFKRLHTGDEYSGTGLGLAICQRIVERYHGRIWVESHLGEGSIFYFTLPQRGLECEGTPAHSDCRGQ